MLASGGGGQAGSAGSVNIKNISIRVKKSVFFKYACHV